MYPKPTVFEILNYGGRFPVQDSAFRVLNAESGTLNPEPNGAGARSLTRIWRGSHMFKGESHAIIKVHVLKVLRSFEYE